MNINSLPLHTVVEIVGSAKLPSAHVVVTIPDAVYPTPHSIVNVSPWFNGSLPSVIVPCSGVLIMPHCSVQNEIGLKCNTIVTSVFYNTLTYPHC